MSPRTSLRLAAVTGDVSDADAASFQQVRQQLFGIAHRVLGSATDADDVVQEAWIRWHRTDRTEVRDAASFLATTTMRLAINLRQSARVRRETHIEAAFIDRADTRADPLLDVQRVETLELAMGALFEKLSPGERAVYVLREAFDYPYRKISEVLPLSEENARQLITRARRRLAADQGRPIDARKRRRFLEAFLIAATTGDLARLERLLTADMARYATAHSMNGRSQVPIAA
jgi:RNA polymerase sigma-70 factor, ECF subfamily